MRTNFVPSLFEYYGFFFENRDISDLKKVLEELLADPKLVEETGKLGREMVLREYNWDKIAEQTENVYKKIMNIT